MSLLNLLNEELLHDLFILFDVQSESLGIRLGSIADSGCELNSSILLNSPGVYCDTSTESLLAEHDSSLAVGSLDKDGVQKEGSGDWSRLGRVSLRRHVSNVLAGSSVSVQDVDPVFGDNGYFFVPEAGHVRIRIHFELLHWHRVVVSSIIRTSPVNYLTADQ